MIFNKRIYFRFVFSIITGVFIQSNAANAEVTVHGLGNWNGDIPSPINVHVSGNQSLCTNSTNTKVELKLHRYSDNSLIKTITRYYPGAAAQSCRYGLYFSAIRNGEFPNNYEHSQWRDPCCWGYVTVKAYINGTKVGSDFYRARGYPNIYGQITRFSGINNYVSRPVKVHLSLSAYSGFCQDQPSKKLSFVVKDKNGMQVSSETFALNSATCSITDRAFSVTNDAGKYPLKFEVVGEHVGISGPSIVESRNLSSLGFHSGGHIRGGNGGGGIGFPGMR
jgi:hypothetical protein